MIRIVLGGLALLISILTGRNLASYHRLRLAKLEELELFICETQSNISYLKMPLIELLSKQIIGDKKIKPLFQKIIEHIEVNKGSLIETEQITDTHFTKSDIDFIFQFLNDVSKIDINGQNNIFTLYNNKLKIIIEDAKVQKRERGDLAQKLGALLGIGLLIIIV